MKRICSLVLSGLLAVSALTGCRGGGASPSAAQPAPSQTGEEKDAVVIVMNMESEPEAGFDPAYGWGAGEHVHEPLIQSTLTVTNPDLTIGYDLATDCTISDDGLTGSPSPPPTWPLPTTQ